MRRRLALWELGGFLFTAALGTVLHFTYGWSGGNLLVAAFSAVNESVWEHMKLLFFPAFFWSVGQVCFLGRNYPIFLAVRALSVLAGTALVPVLYYTYTGIVGTHVLWADIAVFLLAVLGMFALDFRLLRRGRLTGWLAQVLGLAVLWALAFLFVWSTFRPPHLALWRDTAAGVYGRP